MAASTPAPSLDAPDSVRCAMCGAKLARLDLFTHEAVPSIVHVLFVIGVGVVFDPLIGYLSLGIAIAMA